MKNIVPTEKKEREFYYLEHFLKAMGLCLRHIELGTEPPDFVAFFGDRRIAIEITEFHSGAKGVNECPRRAVEEEWKKLRQLIEMEREKDPNIREIGAQLFFKDLHVPSAREHDQFVNELLTYVRKKARDLTKERTRSREFRDEFPLLQAYLKYLDLHITGCYISWDWNYNVSWVGLSEAELMKTIRPKLERARTNDVDEYWLLVVSGPHLSQTMGVPRIEEIRGWQNLNADLGKGPYDRIYVFQYMANRVLLWKPAVGWHEACPPS